MNNKLEELVKYFLCVCLLFSALLLAKKIFYKESVNEEIEISYTPIATLQQIVDVNDIYDINVSFPRYKNDRINDSIVGFVYTYINSFKDRTNDNLDKSFLTINYEVEYKENIANIVFSIHDTTNLNETIKTMFFDVEEGKPLQITDLYDETSLVELINKTASEKYSHYISDVVVNSTLNDFEYKIVDESLYVYFNKSMFSTKISYIPFIILYNEEKTTRVVDISKKLVAFTFDDGPSDNTTSVIECLRLNDSLATFFMLGNRIKYSPEIVLKVLDYNMEIGSHTYAHKKLTTLSEEEVIEEINETNKYFSEITNEGLSLVRPPYGNINNNVKALINYPIILWSVDSNDWLKRNADKIYEYVVNEVKDGDILLMHDTYPETLEAVKMLVPELKARGFEIVTVSELASYKNKTLENNNVYRKIVTE